MQIEISKNSETHIACLQHCNLESLLRKEYSASTACFVIHATDVCSYGISIVLEGAELYVFTLFLNLIWHLIFSLMDKFKKEYA